jgi:hypothetical protein
VSQKHRGFAKSSPEWWVSLNFDPVVMIKKIQADSLPPKSEWCKSYNSWFWLPTPFGLREFKLTPYLEMGAKLDGEFQRVHPSNFLDGE